jgi:hypothetical protein
MELGLAGRRALVTVGLTSLVGFAIAQGLVREGVHAAVCSRDVLPHLRTGGG